MSNELSSSLNSADRSASTPYDAKMVESDIGASLTTILPASPSSSFFCAPSQTTPPSNPSSPVSACVSFPFPHTQSPSSPCFTSSKSVCLAVRGLSYEIVSSSNPVSSCFRKLYQPSHSSSPPSAPPRLSSPDSKSSRTSAFTGNRVTIGNKTVVQILQNVDLCVCPGQLVAIMGPSGAGKTTLLNAMAGRIHLSQPGPAYSMDSGWCSASVNRFRRLLGLRPVAQRAFRRGSSSVERTCNDSLAGGKAGKQGKNGSYKITPPSSSGRPYLPDSSPGAVFVRDDSTRSPSLGSRKGHRIRGLSSGPHLEGEIYLNGLLGSDTLLRQCSSYVLQRDHLFDHLTVRETLLLAAAFKMKDTPRCARIELVDKLLGELGLYRSRHTQVGGNMRKGISGGEMKRVSIGVELLRDPQLLFLDEPTTGLDSSLAFDVLQLLQRLAHNHGRTVVCTVHQPRSQMFEMFDRLILLSRGKVVYQGKTDDVVRYFAKEAGYVCPERFNPADFVLDLLSVDNTSEEKESPLASEEATGEGANGEEDLGVLGLKRKLGLSGTEEGDCLTAITFEEELTELPLGGSKKAGPRKMFGPNCAHGVNESTAPVGESGREGGMKGRVYISEREVERLPEVYSSSFYAQEVQRLVYTHSRRRSGVEGGTGAHRKRRRGVNSAWSDLENPGQEDVVKWVRGQTVLQKVDADGERTSSDVEGAASDHRRDSWLAMTKCEKGGKPRQQGLIGQTWRCVSHWLLEVCLVFWRSFIQWWRNPLSGFFGSIVVHLVLGLVLGGVWYQLRGSEGRQSNLIGLFFKRGNAGIKEEATNQASDFRNVIGAIFFNVLFLSFSCFSAVISFQNERLIFNRETASGLYRPLPYFCGKTLADAAFQHFPPSIFLVSFYYMVGLSKTGDQFFWFFLISHLVLMAANSFCYFLSAALPSTSQVFMVAPLCLVIMMLMSGFFISTFDLPPWCSWMQWLSFIKFGFVALCVNELPPSQSWGIMANGEWLTALGIPKEEHNVVENVVWLAVWGVACRALAFGALKFLNRKQGLEG